MEVINISENSDFMYYELLKEDLYKIIDLQKELSLHLSKSPCFMISDTKNYEE